MKIFKTKCDCIRYYISLLNNHEAYSEFRELRSTEFKETKRTTNKNGELVSKVEKRQQKRLISVPDNHEIKRLSTNTTTGQQWIITEPKRSTEAIEEIDIESIIKKHIKPVETKATPTEETNDFDVSGR